MPTLSNSIAPAPASSRIRVAVIGCNHRTAPVELRERVAFTTQQALDAADELRRRGILEEAVVVSTCNRSELYGVAAETTGEVTDSMEDFLTSFHRLSRADLDGRIYRSTGADAVRHLFRVAAGLDSMLLGEAEILGQLRTAYGQALEHGSTGPVLNRAFQGALEVGKRVRAETEVGARPMSVAFAGVKLAERVFGNLKGHAALIVGAGAVAEQVVDHLQNRGIRSLQVVNRTHERAAELADRTRGKAVAWESLPQALASADVIVTSVGSGTVVSRELLERALKARDGRPIFVIDLGVPRNVAAEAAGLYNLYLYNIDDLGEIVEQNKRARESEIPRAEALINEHLAKCESWRAALEAGSIVDDLRAHFTGHRDALIREHFGAGQDISAEERERLAAITDDLIKRVLAAPEERLQGGRGMRGRLGAVEAIRHLFGLDEGTARGPDDGGDKAGDKVSEKGGQKGEGR
jgi:glutamyl-tRNA reductase